jgi:phage repressor protein C with HTH and peptisase S24 domain
MNDLSQRFLDAYSCLLKEGKVSSSKDFASKIEISTSMMTEITKDRSNVGVSAIQNAVNIFGVNANWLVSGKGEMFKHEAEKKETDIVTKSTRSVPLLPIEAVAGFPGDDSKGITYADCDQYSVPEFDDRGYEFVIRVSGSSMYPKYSNGDILACKKIYDILFFQWGKIYVIDSSQGALVKRVFEDKQNPDCILLVSDNKENYPPFSIPKSDIRGLSIVLGVIRME